MFYVTGHQNPDTDSIVAAISYAALRQADGAIAVRLGPLSPETQFVLERFHFQPPMLISSARTQLSDIDCDHSATVLPDTPITAAWELMKRNDIITLAVTDGANRLLGLVSPGDIAEALLQGVATVADIMSTENIVSFAPEHFVDDARARMLTTRYRSYPVLNADGVILGLVSRYHLIHYRRKQFVLVDHNEHSQSVPGLEQAEILGIIDHHRLGDIQTGSPVYFRNEPVGSTATIIAGLFRETGQSPSKDLAGLMLSGILSDTVLFKSPTCTEKDRAMAAWLSILAGEEESALGHELFAVFDAELLSHTPQQIFFHDFKEYALGGKKIGVGQVTVWSTEKVPSDKIKTFMRTLLKRERFDLLLFMQTEIQREGSYFLCACEDTELISRIFDVPAKKDEFFLNGVMSRKKQVIPMLRAELT